MGVEHKSVEATEALDRGLDHLDGAVAVGDVGDEAQAFDVLAVEEFGRLGETVGASAGDDEAGAERSEVAGDAEADAAGAPGDDDDPVVQIGS